MCVQAHREVFEYLIEDFRTYQPLLAAIKMEYELYITHLEETVEGLEPLMVGRRGEGRGGGEGRWEKERGGEERGVTDDGWVY